MVFSFIQLWSKNSPLIIDSNLIQILIISSFYAKIMLLSNKVAKSHSHGSLLKVPWRTIEMNAPETIGMNTVTGLNGVEP